MSLPITIKLPEHFLEEEVRCGYTITTKQKKIWAIELDLVSRFDSVCKRHGIRYQISWGTLLGAVRHKGFIPWDDDLDVMVDRENYRKICSIPNEEWGEPYFLQTIMTDRKYLSPIARLRNSLTTGVVTGQESPDYNNGIYMDIYVFDGVAPNRFWYQVHSLLKHLALVPLKLKLFPFLFWNWVYNETVSMFSPYVEKIGLALSFKSKAHFQFWMTKSDIKDTILLPYEFLKLPAPNNYDLILRHFYGDYMQFPPVSERGAWHEGIIHFEPDIPYEEYLLKNVELRAR